MQESWRYLGCTWVVCAVVTWGCGGDDPDEQSDDSGSGSTVSTANGTLGSNSSSTNTAGVGGTGGTSTSSTANGSNTSTSSASTDTAVTGSGGATTTGGRTTGEVSITPCEPFELDSCEGNIAGSICHEDLGRRCGCSNTLDCLNGMNCDKETHLCSSDPSIPASCDISDTTFCADDPRGTLCLEGNSGEYNRCGCVSESDCPEGQICDSGPRACAPRP